MRRCAETAQDSNQGNASCTGAGAARSPALLLPSEEQSGVSGAAAPCRAHASRLVTLSEPQPSFSAAAAQPHPANSW